MTDDYPEGLTPNEDASFEEYEVVANAIESLKADTPEEPYEVDPQGAWMEGWDPPYWYRVLLPKSYGTKQWGFEFLTHEAAMKFVGGIVSGGCRLGMKSHRKALDTSEAALSIVRMSRVEVGVDTLYWEELKKERDDKKEEQNNG